MRVPAIWQWPGRIPANSYTTYWGAHTDLLPTFLDAANLLHPLVPVPGSTIASPAISSIRFDGISLLPVLLQATPISSPRDVFNHHSSTAKTIPGEKEIKTRYFSQSQHGEDYPTGFNTPMVSANATIVPMSFGRVMAEIKEATKSNSSLHVAYSGRVFLWHKDTDPYSRDERMQVSECFSFLLEGLSPFLDFLLLCWVEWRVLQGVENHHFDE